MYNCITCTTWTIYSMQEEKRNKLLDFQEFWLFIREKYCRDTLLSDKLFSVETSMASFRTNTTTTCSSTKGIPRTNTNNINSNM